MCGLALRRWKAAGQELGDWRTLGNAEVTRTSQQLPERAAADQRHAVDVAGTEPRQFRADEAQRAARGHVSADWVQSGPDCCHLVAQTVYGGRLVASGDVQPLDAWTE